MASSKRTPLCSCARQSRLWALGCGSKSHVTCRQCRCAAAFVSVSVSRRFPGSSLSSPEARTVLSSSVWPKASAGAAPNTVVGGEAPKVIGGFADGHCPSTPGPQRYDTAACLRLCGSAASPSVSQVLFATQVFEGGLTAACWGPTAGTRATSCNLCRETFAVNFCTKPRLGLSWTLLPRRLRAAYPGLDNLRNVEAHTGHSAKTCRRTVMVSGVRRVGQIRQDPASPERTPQAGPPKNIQIFGRLPCMGAEMFRNSTWYCIVPW